MRIIRSTTLTISGKFTSSVKVPALGRRGISMVELLITAALLAILVTAIVPVFTVTQRGLTSSEAHSSLKSGSQKAINRLQHALVESKRIFENNANDNAYLARVQLGSAPAALTGSRLPTLEENGSLSPSTSTFVASGVGNAVFFASIDAPQDMVVANVSAATVPVRIDTYHFNYYYLAPDSAVKIGPSFKRDLWEWHSVSYADYDQLIGISDAVKRSNTAAALYGRGVRYAWNVSTPVVASAFYNLSSAGAITAASGHNIPASTSVALRPQKMINFKAGLTAGGFRYSVCPNTGGSFNPPVPVPVLATASGQFPSGFEVVAVGPNSARQIFMRLVMVAQGSFKGYISHEQVVLATARDLW